MIETGACTSNCTAQNSGQAGVVPITTGGGAITQAAQDRTRVNVHSTPTPPPVVTNPGGGGSTTPPANPPSNGDGTGNQGGNGNGTGSGSQSGNGNGNGQPSGSSGSQAACTSAKYSADSACGGTPPSNMSSSATGINTYGAALASGSQSAANASYQWAANCSNAWTNCQSQCQSVDPTSASICASYASKVQQAAQQAQSSANDYQAASNTGSSAAATPSSSTTQPDLASNQWGCATNPNGQLCQMCMANSSQQVCSQQPDPTGTSGFQGTGAADAASTGANFNVPDPTAGLSQNPYQQQNQYQQNQYNQQQQAGVPNGGGGGFGGSGQGAKLGGSQRSGGYAPPSGSRADIMQGERGGGFAGYGTGSSGSTDEFNSASNFRRGAQARRPASATGGYLGMDLRRYLPGGMFDPGRQVGGMYRTNNEIMGQTADMFRHISDRIQEHCRLGYLFDCR